MSPLEALWLGIVQGLTEFLPVSSSGHLVLFQTLMGLEEDGDLLFEVGVHVATLLAIVIYFRARILALVKGVFRADADAWRYVGLLVIGTVPAVVVALVAGDAIGATLSSPYVTVAGFFITGGVLWTTRRTLPAATLSGPGWRAALLIGGAQAFAILPGVSRSGSTVAAALALGIAAAPAAEFSFLLGIVAIAGAAVLMLPDLAQSSPDMLAALGVGCIAALISGVGAIWLFVWLLGRQTFHRFSYYTWSVGALFLLYLLMTKP